MMQVLSRLGKGDLSSIREGKRYLGTPDVLAELLREQAAPGFDKEPILWTRRKVGVVAQRAIEQGMMERTWVCRLPRTYGYRLTELGKLTVSAAKPQPLAEVLEFPGSQAKDVDKLNPELGAIVGGIIGALYSSSLGGAALGALIGHVAAGAEGPAPGTQHGSAPPDSKYAPKRDDDDEEATNG